MIHTQQSLCRWLREQGLRISPSTIHHCIQAGMPTVTLPWLQKPRFDQDQVWAWIISTREANPLTLAVRDKIVRQSRRRASA